MCVCANMADGNLSAIAEFLRRSRPFCLWKGCPLLRPSDFIQSNDQMQKTQRARIFDILRILLGFLSFSWYRTSWVIIIALDASCLLFFEYNYGFRLICSVSFPDDAISCDRLSLSRDRSLFVYPTNNTAPCQSSKVVAKAKHLGTNEDKMP